MGQPEFWMGNNFIQSTQIVSDGNWHHIAAVYYMATGDCELYIDGVLEVAGVLAYVAPTINLTLGNDFTGEVLEGKLDEARIWSRAKTASEILNDMCSFNKADTDLVRYFNFEDGINSTIVSDLSVNAVDGNLLNMDPATDWVLGDACGNCEMELSTLITVTIEDTDAPVISNCPANILIDADSPGCTGMASWNDPIAMDDCGTPTFSSTHVSPDFFPVGTTSVTYTFDDGNGNMATCTFDVIVTLNLSASGTSTGSIGLDGTIDLTVVGGNLPFSYSWTGPGGFTSSIEDPTGLAPGTYNVTVTDANGCTTNAQVIVQNEVGIDEIAENDFMIYPNPTNGILLIKSNFKTENNITVMDAAGRLLISKENASDNTSIDLSMMESGIYFVQIKNESVIKTVRVVLQK